jgi:F-type H+-transporting ATPase subunit b
MKRLILWTALAAAVLTATSTARAEEKSAAAGGGAPSGSGGLKAWEWANFIVLAGGLGYIIRKNAGPAFEARGRHIRQAMLEAEEAKKEADSRAAAVELRLARLDDEVAALRAEAKREEQAEHARYIHHAAAEVAKIQARAEQEIAAAGKAARMELKRHAAELALGLAEQKIRARMTAETEDQLVRGYLEDLPGAASAYTN